MFYPSFIDETASPSSPGSVRAWYRQAVRAARERLRRSIANRQAYHELNRLTDHELADIGLHRGGIQSAVSGRGR